MTEQTVVPLESEWLRLRRHLDFSEGFWFGVVFASLAERADLLDRVSHHLRAQHDQLIQLRPQRAEDLPGLLEALLRNAENSPALIWIEPTGVLDATWRAAWRAFASRLNEHRETLRRTHTGIVLAMPSALKSLLRNYAPDLWSIRGIVVELEGETSVGRMIVGDRAIDSSLLSEAMRPRTEPHKDQLRLPLREARRARASPRLWLQAAEELLAAGRYEEARNFAEKISSANSDADMLRARALWTVSNIDLKEQRFDQASRHLQAALDALPAETEDSLRAEWMTLLGEISLEAGYRESRLGRQPADSQTEKARTLFTQALQLAENSGERQSPALTRIKNAALTSLQRIAVDRGDTREALALAAQEADNRRGWHVEIIYAHTDRAWAKQLAEGLHVRGLAVLFDEWQIAPVGDLPESIVAVLQANDAAVIVLSRALLRSRSPMFELWTLLRSRVGKQVVPVLYDLDNLGDLPPSIRTQKWIDLRGVSGIAYERRLDELAAALRPARPPRSPRTIRPPRPQDTAALNLRAYLQRVRDRTRDLRLDGIAASAKVLRYPIERLYTRLQSYSHSLGATDDARTYTASISLGELLHRHHHLLIDGEPGSGKTTFLRLAACMLARDALGEPCPAGASWRAVYLGEGIAPVIPVFLRLSTLATLGASEAHQKSRRGDALLLRHLADISAPEKQHSSDSAIARRAAWDRQLAEGGVMLLLDGLDEVGDLDRREYLFTALQEILRAWPKCQVIVSSRPFGVERIKELGFAHVSVAAFAEAEVRDYVRRWVRALFSTELDPDSDPAAEKRSGKTEEEFADDLETALRARGELRRLASSPVMLACLCVVYTHGKGLPESRVELYSDAIGWLCDTREGLRKREGYGDIRVREALSALALAMMGDEEDGKRREIEIADAATHVEAIVRGPAFENRDATARTDALCRWLRFECEHSGVIEEVGRNRLEFRHLTFQEYLAAARLATLRREEWWPVVRRHLEDLHWREAIDLFPGCLLKQTSSGEADYLISEVHKLWPRQSRLVGAAKITAITGRFSSTLGCAKYRMPRAIAAVDKELRREAEAIFEIRGAAEVPEKMRIAVAEAIGRAGDRRIARERFETNQLSIPLWSGKQRIKLGKYLVTVEEYSHFVADGGYQRPEFWIDGQGWSFRAREGWQEPEFWQEQLDIPNRPIVCVSWFEAMAYCRWLTAEHPHLAVRLPTETEWEHAASWDGQPIPESWGRADHQRANSDERVGVPTPVGLYPAGDGDFGHSDLIGNVWEWCLDAVSRVDSQYRKLRGESYADPKHSVIMAMHKFNFRDNHIGFRVLSETAESCAQNQPLAYTQA